MKLITYSRMILFLFIFIVVTFIPKSTFPEELSPTERDYLRQKGEIVFVSQTRYPPFEFIGPNGEHTGMCIELIRWMAAELGFKAEFTDTSFKNAQEDILSGRADVLTSFFYSDQREKKFDFTREIFQVPASIFVAANRPDIKDLQDLQGKRIAMQTGDYAREFLEEKGIEFRVSYTRDFARATDLMIAGKADAVIGDEQIVLYHIYKNGLAGKVKQVGDPLYIGRNCMATREGNKRLIAILNKGIRRAVKTGILDKIQQKWLGRPITAPESYPARYLLYIGIGAAILLLAVFLIWFWNLRLRHLVNLRTVDLKKSENKYRRIFNSFPDIYFETSLNGKILEISPSVSRVSKYSRRDLLGTDVTLLYVGSENRDRFISRLRADGRVDDFKVIFKGKDGRDVPVSISAMLIKFPERKEPVIVGALRNISERKEIEKRLSYLSLAMECLGEMVIVTNLEHIITYVNASVVEILGYTPEEMINQPAGKFFEGITGNAPDLREWIWASSDKKNDVWRGELFNQKKDGSRIRVYLTLAWLRDNSGEKIGTVGVSMDITEHQALEEQLRHAQKLEAVGTLAGGIAHDFNNLLAGAIGYISIIDGKLPSDSPLHTEFSAVEKLLWRGSDLTRALLSFSRDGSFRPEPLDINNLIKEVLTVIERTVGRNIDLETDLSPEVLSVFGDPGQIHQVLMNLCLNACEAMPDEGRLKIVTGNVDLDSSFFRVHPDLKKGKYVRVSVSDTGQGIKDIIRERIFEPFFSTKADKAGVGLGLSVVAGIVKRHGGSIELESAVNRGSSFAVYLPATEEKADETDQISRRIQGGKKTILIVDDNLDFQKVMDISLRQLGYTVIPARNGFEALKILEKDEKIDLMLLDVIMKGLSGAETFTRVKQIRPDLPIILCTGYSLDPSVRKMLDNGARDVIQKPFGLEVLTTKIHRIFL
ncbi:MAG: transporter substrate-binding domain-containing protein [Candidatus Auribacterota bacterium]|nr:transporter substrate-binding domain-containing protein [Candidatus Auribacterota bacterium]